MKIDQIIRTRRRTLALVIQRDGRLVVRAPFGVTDERIFNFVQRKAEWIRIKQAQVKVNNQRITKQFIEGEIFLFLGQSYRMAFVERQHPALTLDGQFLLAKTITPKAEQAFTRWYKEQAIRVISERVSYYAKRHGFSYTNVRITSARTRWGSCSPKGTLGFTWRLVMAPLSVIDYVVLHELVHLKIKNHSKAFWSNVHALVPDYKQKVAWLKANGHCLTLDAE